MEQPICHRLQTTHTTVITSPIIGMNGAAHISQALNNLYHGYNYRIEGSIGSMGSMISSSKHFAMLECFHDFKKSLPRDEEVDRPLLWVIP